VDISVTNKAELGKGYPRMGLEIEQLDEASELLMQRLLAAADRQKMATGRTPLPRKAPVGPALSPSGTPGVPPTVPPIASARAAGPVVIRLDETPGEFSEPEIDEELSALLAAASRPRGPNGS
jgi:hypothetical protein